MFNKLNVNGAWLQKDVDEWDADEKCVRMKDCLGSLKVVNRLAEPGIKYFQEYADLVKESQYQEDILIVAKDHRGVFKDLRKRAMAV